MALTTNPFENFLQGDQWGSLSPSLGDMLLPQMPQAQYLSSRKAQTFAKQSPRKSRYMQNAYNDIYSDYLGNIGTALRGGQAPKTFDQFLDTDPFTKRYSQLPQFERGVTKTMTNPKTRFIFY